MGGFLEAWTNHVGDPIMSKWIVVVLCVSMGLNAWLLSAARRGAMQPLTMIAARAAGTVEEVKVKVKQEGQLAAPPTISVSQNYDKAASSFSLDESESDDEEKRLVAIKKAGRRTRSMSECMQILTDGRPADLLDEEVIALTMQKKIPLYALEKTLKDYERAVKVRRAVVCTSQNGKLSTDLISSRIYHYNFGIIWSPL